MKRRKFIQVSSAGIPAFTLVPRHVLGGKGFIAPSDKLNIGGIGVGGKGWTNVTQSFNKGSDNIVALCDVDDRMAGEARKKWPKAPYYRDFREMLDKEGDRIDAVTISSPDHMHAVQALEAILQRQSAGEPDCVVRVNDAKGGLVLYRPGSEHADVLYSGTV